ncbi:MAG: hypothetical protein ACRBBO_09020 [Cognatishimia sp.]
MSQSDFSRRLALQGAKQRSAALKQSSGLNSDSLAWITNTILAPLSGVLGLFSSFTTHYTMVNFDFLKSELINQPSFVLTVFIAAAFSVLLIAVFGALAAIMMFDFKKGRLQNVLVPAFFIGLIINSLALSGAALG